MTITASERLMIDELVRGVVNGAEGAADILGDYLDTITVPQGRVSGAEMSDFDPAPFLATPLVPLESTQTAGQITGAWVEEAGAMTREAYERVHARQLNGAWHFIQSTPLPPPPDGATAQTNAAPLNAPAPTLEAMERVVNQFLTAVSEQDAARGIREAVNFSNMELANRIFADQRGHDARDHGLDAQRMPAQQARTATEHAAFLRDLRAREIAAHEQREMGRRAADLPGIPARVQRRPRFG